MARSSRRRHRSTGVGYYLAGSVLILAVVGAFVALATWYVRTPAPPKLDRASLCPVDGPWSVTAILVDTSDDLPDITKKEISTLLLSEAQTLPAYALLQIRVLESTKSAARTILSRCNPGDGQGLSEWTANPAMARKRWLSEFQKPLVDALKSGLVSDPGKTSPIMASIQDLAVELFTGPRTEGRSKRLIIVSDMLENNFGYSQYKDELSFEKYRSTPSYRQFATNLQNAEVSIFYIQRNTRRKIDEKAHVKFWEEWVRDNKGRIGTITRLQGVG